MGRSFYPLVSIPVHGESKTFTLHSHSGKTKHGYISVSLSVRGIKKNTPVKVRGCQLEGGKKTRTTFLEYTSLFCSLF